MVAGQTIGIAGAGSIGCFVGGMLAAGGRRVALLARPRVIAEIEAHGLRPTSFEGFDQTIARDQFALSENPSDFRGRRHRAGHGQERGYRRHGRYHRQARAIGCRHRQPAERRRQCRRPARPPAGAARARRHGAVQRDCARRRAVSSRHFRRHRHRAGRGATGGEAVGAGPDDAARPTTSTACNGASSCSISTTRSMRWPTCRCAGNWPSGHGGNCSPIRWRKAWLRSAPRASSRSRRRRSRSAWMPPLLRLPNLIFEAMLGRTMKIDPEARSSMWEDLQTRPPHRDRLSAGRHHRNRRAARAARRRCRAGSWN